METVVFASLLAGFGLFVAAGVYIVMVREPRAPVQSSTNSEPMAAPSIVSLIDQFGRIRDYMDELESAMRHAGMITSAEAHFFEAQRKLLLRLETRLVSFGSAESEAQIRGVLEKSLRELEELQKRFISGTVGMESSQRS